MISKLRRLFTRAPEPSPYKVELGGSVPLTWNKDITELVDTIGYTMYPSGEVSVKIVLNDKYDGGVLSADPCFIQITHPNSKKNICVAFEQFDSSSSIIRNGRRSTEIFLLGKLET